MKSCHRCQAPWDGPGAPGFNNTCSKCGMPLHSCMNCVQFVARGSVRCLVPHAEHVLDPGAGNRCSFFDFSPRSSATSERQAAAGDHGPDAARRKWSELFKD
jgi:hypothetical protein